MAQVISVTDLWLTGGVKCLSKTEIQLGKLVQIKQRWADAGDVMLSIVFGAQAQMHLTFQTATPAYNPKTEELV